jgi:RNA polymerase sigma-70 factor (ECF subfamily)
VLAPDVVMVPDGGGLVSAARKPVVGAEKLVAFLTAASSKWSEGLVGTPVWLNGAPGARIEADGELAAAVSLTVEHGRVTRMYVVLNPHKLARLDAEATLAR